jgi:ribosome biogenesis protein Nip4
MIKLLNDFIRLFNASLMLDQNLVEKRENRYYLLSENLKRFIKKDFLYAGTYLGETRGGTFLPSSIFLSMIAETAKNKTYVDQKTEWLFVCGRDIFKKGVTRVNGSREKDDFTLIMNVHDECIGFGTMTGALNEKGENVAVRNMFDIGDFLRREK